MKNKEIEELLNRIKNKYEDYYIEDILSDNDLKLLLSYIEQLETDCKEANESITWWQNRYNAIVKQNDDNHKKVVKLEKNRDKAIELLNELKEVTNSKKLSSTYCITNKNWQLLLSYIEQLENNRDKAIEVINTQLKNAEGGLKDNLRIIKFNLIKGSCTFEDLKTEEDYKYVLKGDSDYE